MAHEVTVPWLKSGKYAQVDGIRVRPMEHRMLPGSPVAVQRGQAEALFLLGENGSGWILKKFHQGRCPDDSYLRAVGAVLPQHDGLVSGTDRRVLSGSDLRKEPGCYFSTELQQWLASTVLMPRVQGIDWVAVADDLRDGSLRLDREQRVTLCRQLAELVRFLEAASCAHRDISSGNTFIDMHNWVVILIDFDSLYHPSLQMPAATTCGTEGYTPPFVWQSGTTHPEATWCPHADRFALTLVSVEFLVLDKGAPLEAEGGMFDQGHLRVRKGATLRLARDRLRDAYPGALPLIDAAINSRTCAECPGPDDWLHFCDVELGPVVKPPPLDTLEDVSPDDFAHILQKRIPAAPVWPAPQLDELRWEPPGLRSASRSIIALPADPWAASYQARGGDSALPNKGPSGDLLEDPW